MNTIFTIFMVVWLPRMPGLVSPGGAIAPLPLPVSGIMPKTTNPRQIRGERHEEEVGGLVRDGGEVAVVRGGLLTLPPRRGPVHGAGDMLVAEARGRGRQVVGHPAIGTH